MSALDLEHRAAGFYVSLIAAVLAFVTGIVYQVSYSSNQYYSFWVFILLMVALPAWILLQLVKLDGFAPAVVTALAGCALLAFVYAMYFDVSVVLVGIDKQGFDPEFLACSVMLVFSFLLGEVSIYLRSRKDTVS